MKKKKYLTSNAKTAIVLELLIPKVKALPKYFSELPINPGKKEFPATGAALGDLFWIEKKFPQDEAWAECTGHPERKYINKVLVPQLLVVKQKTGLVDKIRFACRQYLQERVNNQPQPPADWSRKVPSAISKNREWHLLKTFLKSPDQQVFDYRKKQSERNELEYAIKRMVIDLTTETIRQGSPHTLRITKTQAAYNRAMEKWEEDRDLLSKIK